jgi:hypothetical protein
LLSFFSSKKTFGQVEEENEEEEEIARQKKYKSFFCSSLQF